MIEVKFAKNKIELDNIIELRYKILRQPWHQPFESSTDGMEDSTYNAFIENEGGKVVACGRLQENDNHIGQIRYMAVSNGEQGKGFGKMILKALEEKAIEIGLTAIELQARENAVAFYERHDYKLKQKSFKLWDTIQHYLMEKKLN